VELVTCLLDIMITLLYFFWKRQFVQDSQL